MTLTRQDTEQRLCSLVTEVATELGMAAVKPHDCFCGDYTGKLSDSLRRLNEATYECDDQFIRFIEAATKAALVEFQAQRRQSLKRMSVVAEQAGDYEA